MFTFSFKFSSEENSVYFNDVKFEYLAQGFTMAITIMRGLPGSFDKVYISFERPLPNDQVGYNFIEVTRDELHDLFVQGLWNL